MNDARAYNRQLAQRLATLISKEPNPREAMAEIAQAAEAGGLIDSDNLPRRRNPETFAQDLLTDNPLADDWIALRLETMPDPLRITELEQIVARLKDRKSVV